MPIIPFTGFVQKKRWPMLRIGSDPDDLDCRPIPGQLPRAGDIPQAWQAAGKAAIKRAANVAPAGELGLVTLGKGLARFSMGLPCGGKAMRAKMPQRSGKLGVQNSVIHGIKRSVGIVNARQNLRKTIGIGIGFGIGIDFGIVISGAGKG